MPDIIDQTVPNVFASNTNEIFSAFPLVSKKTHIPGKEAVSRLFVILHSKNVLEVHCLWPQVTPGKVLTGTQEKFLYRKGC